MAEPQHDDLADALAQMTGGDPTPQVPAPPVRPVKPLSTHPAPLKPIVAQVPKPGGPAPILRPVVPVVRSRTAGPTLSNSVSSVPTPGTPTGRAARPLAPTLRSVTVPTDPNQPEVDGNQSTALSGETGEVFDDDDSVIVPAPDPSVFEYRAKTTADVRARIAMKRNLEFRRTLIPILLTSGILLLGFASLKFVSGSDSVLADLPLWIPAILIVLALLFLALAAANMLSVKSQLQSGK